MRRVVITGLGAVSPCGNSAQETWSSMLNARSGIALLQGVETSELPVKIGGQVVGLDPVQELGKRVAKRMDRFCQFGVLAGEEAWADAGLNDYQGDPTLLGAYIGTGVGGLSEIINAARSFEAHGTRGLSVFFIPRTLTNLAAGHLSMRLNLQGPSLCVSTACATGNHSIGEAYYAIQRGDADVILAGGAEAPLVPSCLGGFAVMRTLSRNNEHPEQASRPFDADRDGFVMGEGAGVVVLEELEHALARGARIYAELGGYALNSDAHHLTAPSPRGSGAGRCMKLALDRAGVRLDQVQYINAHGTSTPLNDQSESEAIVDLFAEHASKLMVSSTKSVTGHLLGAAGGVEAVASAMSVYEGRVPPTANWSTRDPDCPLDYVPGDARELQVDVALSNSFGFGGTNATLVFKRFLG